ncbi:zinc protease [Nitrosospira sp. Nsp5]|uniref:Zinc protease n=1 Tax=Nitrosospira multiformis TaxID=1231 RepID=A0ABY0T701_9PROT|nr:MULTISPECIES: pitrilysin family protein [Nitrosospira]PTR06599.1 zinc protease [Nitrosospira sp. Nsp5]SDQ36683.1 zinc protease [Nitrosospira multiformis]
MQVIRCVFILLLGTCSQWAFATLPIQHWQAASGAQVYFVESRDLPILDVSVDFSAGSGTDTPDKSGRAGLALYLLSLGAGGLSEDQIAKAIADIGAQLGAHFDQDRAGVTLRTLSSARERKQALDILGRVIQHPEFVVTVLEREQQRIIAGLKEADTKPDIIADRALMKMLYGSHPYGLRGSGEIETVGALRRDDLMDFYRSRYSAPGAVVSIMGDVSRAEAAAIAESLTSELPQSVPAYVIPAVTEPVPETKRITHPATQSHILLAYPGLRRDDPDYFPLLVGNYVLGGGGFTSRLMEEIRQKRGLAYSVNSHFSPLREKGPFEISLQTRKEQSEEALVLTRKVLADFVAGGPTEKELVAAKQNIIGSFPLRLDSNRKILGYLSVIGFYDLPLTYLDDYLKAVGNVTVAQIKDAFQRRIKPEGMVGVVVGAMEKK